MAADIENIINNLSADVSKKKMLPKSKFFTILFFAYIAFIFFNLAVFGVDGNIYFNPEIIFLSGIFISSLVSSFYISYPDFYQKKNLVYLPIILFGLFLVFLTYQFFKLSDFEFEPDFHDFYCTIHIAVGAFILSAVIFYLINKGATTSPKLAGIISVLNASSLACLVILITDDCADYMFHLIISHYLPILLFAYIGTLFGKNFLKW